MNEKLFIVLNSKEYDRVYAPAGTRKKDILHALLTCRLLQLQTDKCDVIITLSAAMNI